MDSAYLQLKLSVQKKAKNRANVEKDTKKKRSRQGIDTDNSNNKGT
jgi:hypothetical protein